MAVVVACAPKTSSDGGAGDAAHVERGAHVVEAHAPAEWREEARDELAVTGRRVTRLGKWQPRRAAAPVLRLRGLLPIGARTTVLL